MTKNEFIKALIDRNMTDDQIIENLVTGDFEKGIKPSTPTFAKLQLRKYYKSFPKV